MKNIVISFFLLVSGFIYSSGQTTVKNLWQPYYITPRTGSQHLDLQRNWQLIHSDSVIDDISLMLWDSAITVEEPTSVHMALHKAGKLPHPYAHLNSRLYRWVEEKVWYYRKAVEIPESAKGNFIFLCFDGIDYFSKVWINGKLMGHHEGMFGGPDIDISQIVNFGGNNEIVAEVRAANWGNRATNIEDLPRTANGERDYSKRSGYNPWKSGRIIKPWIISGGSGTESFFSLGMWKGARIEVLNPYHLERPFMVTESIKNNKAHLHLSCEILADINSLNLELHPWHNSQIHHPGAGGIAY